ncbi:hypothetical protein ONZ45_g1527 [Pleurotus djamor]|nr:hypothetical protein ONZ45_g1527 [Pleurotus djamor]
MFWPKRRSSRPSVVPQQPQQQHNPQFPISSALSSTITTSSSSTSTEATTSTPSSASLARTAARLAQPEPQIVAVNTSFKLAESSQSAVATTQYQRGTGEFDMDDPRANNYASPSKARHAADPTQAPPRPTFQPTWTHGIPSNDPNLFQELSTFQFGAPAIPSSSTPPPSLPSVPQGQNGDDDEFVSPLTINDVTPRPSVVSSAISELPNSYRSHPPNDTNPFPQDTFHSNQSQSSVAIFVSERILFEPSSRISIRSTASFLVATGKGASPPRDHDPVNACGEFSVWIRIVVFLSFRIRDLSYYGMHNDRDIEFSSEEEYEYDDEDDFDQDIEVSSAYLDEGHRDFPDFYSFRGGSVPMAIPGTSETSHNATSSSGASRDREGSMATLRRPSRSVDDELRSYTFGAPSRSTGAIPVSDPLTRGEWSAMESRQDSMRSIGPLDSTDVVTPTFARSLVRTAVISTAVSNSGDVSAFGFDADWGDLRGGITSMTANDIAGLVDLNPTVAPARRPSGGLSNLFFGGNTSPGPNSAGGGRARLGSWFSSGSRRQSEATVTDDTFTRNVRRWDGSYGSRRRDWSFRREKGFPGAELTVSSTSAGRSIVVERTESTSSGVFGSSQKANVSNDAERERDKEKEKRKPPKGMAIGSTEMWSSEIVGRFKVDRKAARPLDSSKPPQQRLNLVPQTSSESDAPRPTRPGPPVTVHKHSKAIAFSISRQHNKPRRPREAGGRGIPSTVPRSSMIMLAPKRVQEQYTNTTTTRRLDTHGLLEDAGFRREQDRRDRELERERERRRRVEEQRQQVTEVPTTRSSSSVNSLGNGRELYPTPPPASAPSLHTYPPPPAHQLRKHPSSRSLRSTNDPEPPVPGPSSSRVTRRVRRDPYDFDDGDEDELPTRTPHAETYATIDPAQVELLRQNQSRIDSDQGRSLIRRILGRSQSTAVGGPPSASIDGSFKAPWLTLAPRAKQEEHERVVANLNESFIDVGLLPSRPTHKSKATSAQKQKQAKNKHNTQGSGSNIFEQVPPDSLYMLLPLWPGETDPLSEKLPNEPKKPVVPLEQRLYLLVYYVADEVKPKDHDSWSKSELETRSNKKSRSPTSSGDLAGRRLDDRSILLSAFHVSARLVGYDELRTSGMRVPDEGLSVTGPMSEAMRTMPSSNLRDQNQLDFLIAMCHSRDAGMEFIQEGLIKMGLCLVTPQSRQSSVPPDETEEPEEPDVVLSPIGRAVVEMAWVGCMALTSFGPTT